MVTVTRTFTVPVPQDEAVEYLKDFGNAEEWDPGTQRCTRVDAGPIAVGSTWRNVSKVLGRETELDYRLTELRADGVVFEGRNKTATSVDDITVAAQGESSEITYRARIQFNGLARLADPLMQRVFEGLGDETVAQMTAALTDHAIRRG